jgi:hypothetical protein
VASPASSSGSTFVAQSAFVVESEPFDPWTIDHLFESTIGRPSVIDYGSSASGGNLYTLASEKGLWADFNFAPDTPTPLSDFKVGFVAESKNFFADPRLTDFYVVSGDGYQTNTRVDGSTVALELVVDDSSRKILNSQITVS